MSISLSVRESLALLSRRDKILLGLASAIQMSTSALDVAGVLLIGLVAATAVTTVQSQPPPEQVEVLMSIVSLENLQSQEIVAVLAGLAALVLLTKSILSSYLTRKVFSFLANRQAIVSARLVKAFLAMPLTFIYKRSSQETAFALINGAGAATMSILGLLVVAITEIALLLALSIALLLIDPIIAFASILFFFLTAIFLQRLLGGWASRVGSASAQADIASLNSIQEAISAYRELVVLNRRSLYVDRIQKLRWVAANVAADSQFLGMLPKYLFEAALVIGGFALTFYLFATQDAITAVGTLGLFLAASTRVMPSLLRLQGAALGMRAAAGTAEPTFQLARELGHPVETDSAAVAASDIRHRIAEGNPDFVPVAILNGISVTYPNAEYPALNDVSLKFDPGSFVALTGSSGAGKSTLADVILGVLEPDRGTVVVNGLRPVVAADRWPGALAYVPQDVMLANDTIRGNVALGLPPDAIDDQLVWRALERAHLANFLADSREGLDTWIGENGVKLSGGQRQRLGIARALYTQPKLIVLDEATSALDAKTENSISQTIAELGNSVTRIIIAHRLSTVVNADQVVFLEDGQVLASGTFAEVRAKVPAFNVQARLMGIR